MSWKKAFIAATALMLPAAAQAQPFGMNLSGFYIGGGAGVNYRQDSDISLSGAAVTGPFGVGAANANGSIGWNPGFVGVLNAGYGFGNGLRVEAEFSYRYENVDKVSGVGQGAYSRTGGHTSTYAFMGNVLYDFNVGLPVVPYVGAGIGYAISSFDQVRAQSTAVFPSQTNIAGNDGRFAYQGIVGLGMPIAAVPGLTLTAEYRYFATLDADLDVTSYKPTGFSRGTTEIENTNHSFLLGVRYAFGVTPPPPPVAPAVAPVPARTFLVFFDFDRANLTERARQIIAEAANNSRSAGVTRIEVSGHTDTVGSARYNQGLSERRANAVAAELERLGVPRSSMVIQGFGFTRLLVPTGPGVREPQNRRVEIVLK
ncbi:OmpA family protein [Roseomonas sp. AR75]|uniref:OmpA family protein n=1 Tax=Roseomonas sp. AR75 TaxID=2562311 RepID=UPI0010C0164E|nr:OmpA family protein [Roseomonas sp. AR75]